MSPARTVRWSPPEEDSGPPIDLPARLAELAQDRASAAVELNREACAVVRAWLLARPAESCAPDWRELSAALAPFAAAHGWRAQVALFVDWIEAWIEDGAGPRAALIEELGVRMGGAEVEGVPTAPDPARVARLAAEELDAGEVVLLHGPAHLAAEAIVLAASDGRRAEVVLSEGGPELHGRRAAARLAAADLGCRFVHDLALAAEVERADRVWVETEAIGAAELVAPLGTGLLIREARRREVPVTLLATTDQVAPEGAVALPEWGATTPWLLWADAPARTRVEPQPYECVSLALVDRILTERGPLSPARLALEALPLPRSAPPTLPQASPARAPSPASA